MSKAITEDEIKALREVVREARGKGPDSVEWVQMIRSFPIPQTIDSLLDEIERRRKWQSDVEEREAAVCPEDVPFDEYIRTLEKKAGVAAQPGDAQLDEIRERLKRFLNGQFSLIAQHATTTAEDRDITGDVADLLSCIQPAGELTVEAALKQLKEAYPTAAVSVQFATDGRDNWTYLRRRNKVVAGDRNVTLAELVRAWANSQTVEQKGS